MTPNETIDSNQCATEHRGITGDVHTCSSVLLFLLVQTNKENNKFSPGSHCHF